MESKDVEGGTKNSTVNITVVCEYLSRANLGSTSSKQIIVVLTLIWVSEGMRVWLSDPRDP